MTERAEPFYLLGVHPWEEIWDELNHHYDRAGRPISMREWALLREDGKRVAQSTIKGYWISTVWLGIDLGLYTGSRPLIFESMVFGRSRRGSRKISFTDLYMDRYSTERDALRGHLDICRMIRSGWKGPKR